MPFFGGALFAAVGVWITRYLVFLVAKMTLRLAVSIFVLAAYIAFFIYAVDLMHDIYNKTKVVLNLLETTPTSNSTAFNVASASGILKAVIDVITIDIGFIYILLQYKLFILLRNLYTRGGNEVDKTINVLN